MIEEEIIISWMDLWVIYQLSDWGLHEDLFRNEIEYCFKESQRREEQYDY